MFKYVPVLPIPRGSVVKKNCVWGGVPVCILKHRMDFIRLKKIHSARGGGAAAAAGPRRSDGKTEKCFYFQNRNRSVGRSHRVSLQCYPDRHFEIKQCCGSSRIRNFFPDPEDICSRSGSRHNERKKWIKMLFLTLCLWILDCRTVVWTRKCQISL